MLARTINGTRKIGFVATLKLLLVVVVVVFFCSVLDVFNCLTLINHFYFKL